MGSSKVPQMVDFFLSYRRFHLPRFARHQMRRRIQSTVVATTRITESGSFSLLLFSPIVIFREPLFDLSLSLSSLLSFSSLSSSTSLFCEVMDDQLFDASVDSSIADGGDDGEEEKRKSIRGNDDDDDDDYDDDDDARAQS